MEFWRRFFINSVPCFMFGGVFLHIGLQQASWFWSQPRSERMVERMGERNARLIYIMIGGGMVLGGVLIAFGVLTPPRGRIAP